MPRPNASKGKSIWACGIARRRPALCGRLLRLAKNRLSNAARASLLVARPQNGAWVAAWNGCVALVHRGARPALCGLATPACGTGCRTRRVHRWRCAARRGRSRSILPGDPAKGRMSHVARHGNARLEEFAFIGLVLAAMRTVIGFRHWKRVDGSNARTVCSSAAPLRTWGIA